MKKIVRKVMSIAIATILTLVLYASLTTFAGGGESGIGYYDIYDINNYDTVFFSENDEVEDFVFEAPDGSIVTVGMEELRFSGRSATFQPAFLTQVGKYTLKSFPVPKGYEVVTTFFIPSNRWTANFSEEDDQFYTLPIETDGFTVTQFQMDWMNERREYFNSYDEPDYDFGTYDIDVCVYLRKAGLPYEALSFTMPTSSTVLINGEEVFFGAYNINDNNYFKLRDLAYALNGSEKQFEVGWDEGSNSISLTSKAPYSSDMEWSGNGFPQVYTPTNSKVTLDGLEIQFTAYNINGNNYFKLRDIATAFDFCVDWDGERNTIVIETGKGYTAE